MLAVRGWNKFKTDFPHTCVCVCVYVLESKSVCVCEKEFMCVCVRVRVYVCVCVSDFGREREINWEREREMYRKRERVCVCACLCVRREKNEREKEIVSVCLHVYVLGRERERKGKRKRERKCVCVCMCVNKMLLSFNLLRKRSVADMWYEIRTRNVAFDFHIFLQEILFAINLNLQHTWHERDDSRSHGIIKSSKKILQSNLLYLFVYFLYQGDFKSTKRLFTYVRKVSKARHPFTNLSWF